MRFVKKFLFATFIFLFLFSTFFSKDFLTNVNAQIKADCSIIVHSNDRRSDSGESLPADSTDKWIVLNINTYGNLRDNDYRIAINKTDGDKGFFDNTLVQLDPGRVFQFRPNVELDGVNLWPGEIIIFSMSASGDLKGNPQDGTFKPGIYSVKIIRSNNPSDNSVCNDMSFEIKSPDTPGGGGSSNYCKVVIDEENTLNNDDKVKFHVEFGDDYKDQNSVKNADHSHRVKLKTDNYGERMNTEYRTDELGTGENPGLAPKDDQGLSTGGYYLEVFENASSIIFFDEGKSCRSDYFSIRVNGGEICRDADNIDQCGFQPKRPLAQPCRQGDWDPDKGCIRIKTALGTIGTEAPEFVRWVLGFVLGISGGIVLIIIIISGYRLMTSQGDPEKVKNARDQLTAAVVGLIFIIFSLVILQLITKNILQLPGFGG